jgi:hypothetical protein
LPQSRWEIYLQNQASTYNTQTRVTADLIINLLHELRQRLLYNSEIQYPVNTFRQPWTYFRTSYSELKTNFHFRIAGHLFVCNPILSAICTSIFGKLCKN